MFKIGLLIVEIELSWELWKTILAYVFAKQQKRKLEKTRCDG